MNLTFSKIISYVFVVLLLLALLFLAQVVFSWSSPTASPPNNNVPGPLNTGATAQNKSGDLLINASLGANSLNVFGNTVLNGSTRHLNWGTTAGATGYGIRENAGTLEFRVNAASTWKTLQTIVNEYIALGGSQWTTNGSNIYYNTGNVGVGLTNPTAGKLAVTSSNLSAIDTQ